MSVFAFFLLREPFFPYHNIPILLPFFNFLAFLPILISPFLVFLSISISVIYLFPFSYRHFCSFFPSQYLQYGCFDFVIAIFVLSFHLNICNIFVSISLLPFLFFLPISISAIWLSSAQASYLSLPPSPWQPLSHFPNVVIWKISSNVLSSDNGNRVNNVDRKI